MIIGVGTDIIAIRRVAQVLELFGQRFINRLCGVAERTSVTPTAAALAKIWAAKEAAAKALGTGLRRGVSWHDFTISRTDLGQPELRVSGTAAQLAPANARWYLALSDEADYAVAFVILTKSQQ